MRRSVDRRPMRQRQQEELQRLAKEVPVAVADPNREAEQARLIERLHENRGRIRPAPLCPVDSVHGPVLSWSDGRVFCPHLGHGGNGKFFRSAEVDT